MAGYRHQLDRLRAVDAAENAQLLAEGARRARRAVRPVREGSAPLRKAVEDAVRAEREAEDRCRDAMSHLRRVTRAEEKARRDRRDRGPDRGAAADPAAADVAQGDQAAVEGATSVRKAAEQALSNHLGHLARLEDEAVTAEWAASTPPPSCRRASGRACWPTLSRCSWLPDLGRRGAGPGSGADRQPGQARGRR